MSDEPFPKELNPINIPRLDTLRYIEGFKLLLTVCRWINWNEPHLSAVRFDRKLGVAVEVTPTVAGEKP